MCNRDDKGVMAPFQIGRTASIDHQSLAYWLYSLGFCRCGLLVLKELSQTCFLDEYSLDPLPTPPPTRVAIDAPKHSIGQDNTAQTTVAD